MCLVTHRSVHQFAHAQGSRIVALETRRPILVWKALIFKKAFHGMVSPFRLVPYEFGKLYHSPMQTSFELDSLYPTPPRPTDGRLLFEQMWAGYHRNRIQTTKVFEGLHSYTDRWKAEMSGNPFPSIIPEGSRVWFGDDFDIVSDQLVVYKHPEDLLAVHGSVTEPKPWKELVRKNEC